MRLQYDEAVKITVEVGSPARYPDLNVKTLDMTWPSSGELVVPVMLRNTEAEIRIRMDSAGSDGIVGISWEGTYHARAARV